MAGAGVARANDMSPERVTGVPGKYRIQLPPKGIPAIQLPEGEQSSSTARGSAEYNDCLRGDVQGVFWSPDGRFLVAEINSSDSVTLCLYYLGVLNIRDVDQKHLVTVSRVTAVAGIGDRAEAPATGLKAMGGSRARLFSEGDPAWASPAGAGNLLAFSSDQADRRSRAFFLREEALITRSRDVLPLDGRGKDEWPPNAYFQPAWSPAAPRGAAPSAASRVVVVTDQGAGCAMTHLASFAAPGATGGVDMTTFKSLTTPCERSQAPGGENIADRYPAWDPGPERDRLAFIRADVRHGRNQVCVLSGARGSSPGLKCDYAPPAETDAKTGKPIPISRTFPAWSDDGRFLVYYATLEERGGKDASNEGGKVERIEYIDLASSTPRPKVLRRSVRANQNQPPALLFDPSSRTTWVLAIEADANGLHNRLTATPIPTGDGAPVPLEIDTGLQNLKAVSAGLMGGKYVLAVVAQSYRASTGLSGGDLKRDKVYVMSLTKPDIAERR
jgi:hypothetical protein